MKTGDLLWWLVIDRLTNECVLACKTRREAREFARECDGRIAYVVLSK